MFGKPNKSINVLIKYELEIVGSPVVIAQDPGFRGIRDQVEKSKFMVDVVCYFLSEVFNNVTSPQEVVCRFSLSVTKGT